MRIKPRYILIAVSGILSFITSKMEEKEQQELLEAKVDRAIIDACIKVGMLEEVEGGN